MTSNSVNEFYSSNEKYLFLGNGYNQLTKRFSWDDLLSNVCKAVGLNIKRNQKTYPLFFEEISFQLNKSETVEDNVKLLKEAIGKEALKLEAPEILKQLISNNYYSHYLTTNYDYCIERCIDPKYDPKSGKNEKRPKYSLYRFNLVNGRQVWHIHGESNNGFNGKKRDYPEASILIGFEHYSDYLEKIHHFIKSNTGKGLSELIKKEIDRHILNWVHLFFIRDIDILGFGMDYTEAHLWFILNFRARLKRKKIDIPNKICWIIPSFSEGDQMDKIALLNALDVEVKTIPVPNKNDYEGFYREFVSTLVKDSK